MRVPLLVIAFITACASGPAASDAGEITPGESFRLRMEEEAQLRDEGITVRFAALIGDSRCPRDVTCFWAGDAEIEVLLTHGGQEAALHLHTHGGPRYPRQAAASGFTLRLESLDPYPETSEPIEPRDYVATLVMTPGEPSAESDSADS